MSNSRPSAGQAIVIALSAIALLVTACFGALGVGATFTSGPLPALGALVLLVVVALGVTGFLVGIVRFIGAVTRTIRSAPGPAHEPGRPADTSAPAMPLPAAPAAAGRRPTFAQAFVLFTAGVVVFSGACIGLVDGGKRQSDLSALLWTLVLAAATAAAVWGFSSMIWGRRAQAGPEPPPAAAPPPAEEPRA